MKCAASKECKCTTTICLIELLLEKKHQRLRRDGHNKALIVQNFRTSVRVIVNECFFCCMCGFMCSGVSCISCIRCSCLFFLYIFIYIYICMPIASVGSVKTSWGSRARNFWNRRTFRCLAFSPNRKPFAVGGARNSALGGTCLRSRSSSCSPKCASRN